MQFEYELIKWGAYILVGVTGWFIRVLWVAGQEMRKDFSELEKELPIYYLRKDEFKDYVKEMKEVFRESINPILNKLDRMEEKMRDQQREVDRLQGPKN